jgi:hypothetical protein
MLFDIRSSYADADSGAPFLVESDISFASPSIAVGTQNDPIAMTASTCVPTDISVTARSELNGEGTTPTAARLGQTKAVSLSATRVGRHKHAPGGADQRLQTGAHDGATTASGLASVSLSL